MLGRLNELWSERKVLEYLASEPIIGGWQDIVFILFCFFLTIYFILKIANSLRVRDISLYLFLFIYHHIFTLLLYYFGKYGVTTMDSRLYYIKGVNPNAYYYHDIKFSYASDFLFWLADILVNVLGLNYLSCNVLFSTIGLLGLFMLMSICSKLGVKKNVKHLGIYILPLLLYLPNMHLWTCYFGKDGLILFGIILFIYSFLFQGWRRNICMFLGGFIVLIIRPHVFLLLMLSLCAVIFLFSSMKWYMKIPLLALLSVFGFVVLQWMFSKLLGLGTVDLKVLVGFLDSRSGYYVKNNYVGSVVDLSGYPLPFKMFTYLFRPLFEKMNFNYIVAGIDNLFALFLVTALFSRKLWSYLKQSEFVIKLIFIFVLIGSAFFGALMSNFGIAMRQKTMFVLPLYIIILAFIAYKDRLKQERRAIVDLISE